MDNLTRKEACDNEIRLIKEYKDLGYKLTNITNGGEGWNNTEFTEEHKKNISKNHADVNGKNNPMYGKNHTKETLDKIKEKKRKWFKEIGYNEYQINNMKIRSQGEGNSNSILNKEEVLKIRELYKEGYKQNKLANMFSIKASAVWKIINRYTWKHI